MVIPASEKHENGLGEGFYRQTGLIDFSRFLKGIRNLSRKLQLDYLSRLDMTAAI